MLAESKLNAFGAALQQQSDKQCLDMLAKSKKRTLLEGGAGLAESASLQLLSC